MKSKVHALPGAMMIYSAKHPKKSTGELSFTTGTQSRRMKTFQLVMIIPISHATLKRNPPASNQAPTSSITFGITCLT